VKTSEIVAIKIVNKSVFEKNKKSKELFDSEIEVLRRLADLNNENIVKFIDYF